VGYACRQVQLCPSRIRQFPLADNDPALAHERRKKGPNACEQAVAVYGLAGGEIDMRKRDAAGEALAHPRKLLAHIAEDEMIAVGQAVRVGRDLPLEDENLPVRQDLAKVVEGAPVAEAELQDDAVHTGNQAGRMGEAVPLRL
jgi:hypothetical protein